MASHNIGNLYTRFDEEFDKNFTIGKHYSCELTPYDPIYKVKILEIKERCLVLDINGQLPNFWRDENHTKELLKGNQPGTYWLDKGLLDTFFFEDIETNREQALNEIGIK
jgi:hypothetical protein